MHIEQDTIQNSIKEASSPDTATVTSKVKTVANNDSSSTPVPKIGKKYREEFHTSNENTLNDSLSLHSLTNSEIKKDSFTFLPSNFWGTEQFSFDSLLSSLDANTKKAESKSEHITKYDGIDKPFSLEHVDGVFALLLFCLLILAMLTKSGITFLSGKNFYSLFKTKRSFGYSYREFTYTEIWSKIFFIFLTIFLSSIIIYNYFMEYSVSEVAHDFIFFKIFLFMLVFLIFFLIKILIYSLFGYLFDMKNEMSQWKNDYITIINLFGISLFIPTLYLIYSDHYHIIALIFVFILFIFTSLIIFYRIISFFLHQNVNYLFLIIYLCSVEILPIIILYYSLEFIYKMDIISVL